MILQKLIDLFTQLASVLPEFLRPLFDFIISILTAILGNGG